MKDHYCLCKGRKGRNTHWAIEIYKVYEKSPKWIERKKARANVVVKAASRAK